MDTRGTSVTAFELQKPRGGGGMRARSGPPMGTPGGGGEDGEGAGGVSRGCGERGEGGGEGGGDGGGEGGEGDGGRGSTASSFLVARPGVIREPFSAVLHGPASGVHPCLAPRSMRYCQHTRDRASGERARSADARWAQGMLDGQQGVRARVRADTEAESQRAEQAYTVRTRLVGLCWRRERETGERSERVRSRACEGVHGHASAHRARRRSHAPRGAPPDADSRGESARSSLDTIAPKARALGLAARPNSPQGQSARSGGPTVSPQGQSARSGGPTDSTARPEKKPSSTRNMDLWLIFSIAGPSRSGSPPTACQPTSHDKATTTYQSLPPHYMRV